MADELWVLDVTNADIRAFCPIDPDGTIVAGLTYVGDRPPGRLVGVFHKQGDDAVEAWWSANPDVIAELWPDAQ